jgi:hypothetical protein
MQITPELQKIIDSEVEKRTIVLENTYRENFEELKESIYARVKTYAAEAIVNSPKFESVDAKCESMYYKPLVEGIVKLLKDNGIPLYLSESISPTEAHESKALLMEAVKKIQELRDMISIHEMIENNLAGLDRGIIENAVNKFKADGRYEKMKKEDFLKEVTSYVLNMKNMPTNKSVQFESSELITDKELGEVDSLLESKGGLNDKFNPKTKINIPSLRKVVLDEAIHLPDVESDDLYDPAQEVLDSWNTK